MYSYYYCLDPLSDPRWAQLVYRDPRSSVFHSVAWLHAISSTYGYEPVAITASSPDEAELESGIVFCNVRSRFTGNRLVSLPFSDHCEPLVKDDLQFAALLSHCAKECASKDWKYIELRPLRDHVLCPPYSTTASFYVHELDLSASEQTIFAKFHKSSVQRKIIRAQRDSLEFREGISKQILRDFYRLVVLTRRRHGLPPQPHNWFKNLAQYLAGSIKIHLAFKNERPIAGVLMIRHKRTLFYKYGASDSAFHSTGGMQALFWRVIQQARADGLESLDLGRTDVNDPGLVTFKNRLGARRRTVSYFSYPRTNHLMSGQTWKTNAARRLFTRMPLRLLAASGSLIYRHLG